MKIYLAIGAVAIVLLFGELIAWIIMARYPTYDVLFLSPHPVLGWTLTPDLKWRWAGHYWYASDFSVNVKNNSLGFRDTEWTVRKSRERIAMIGDSLIEAVQVPFDKTSSQIIEEDTGAEVLNFGVSCYGLGQFYLVWEEYAKHFNPDYAVILLAGGHMSRTVEKNPIGTLRRPMFSIHDKKLVVEPPGDFKESLDEYNLIRKREYQGGYMRKRSPDHLITLYYLKRIFYHLGQKISPSPFVETHADKTTLDLNFKILSTMNDSMKQSGCKLIVLDASTYFNPADIYLSIEIVSFCIKKNIGYVDLSRNLKRVTDAGVPVRWKRDYHFNEIGNIIVADAVMGALW
jgi:hypothetical protein